MSGAFFFAKKGKPVVIHRELCSVKKEDMTSYTVLKNGESCFIEGKTNVYEKMKK